MTPLKDHARECVKELMETVRVKSKQHGIPWEDIVYKHMLIVATETLKDYTTEDATTIDGANT